MKKILIFKGNSRLCYTLILQLLLLPAYAFQQQYVTGLVTDASGALPGVIVTLKDTPTATLTDQNGYYALEAQPGQVLVFSYLGYQTQEVAITENTINIFMEPDATMLAEVEINAGYYTVKDRERTGSIARVTAKDIEKQPVSNPLAAMQGRMAGVSITQTTGVPGGGFDVQIRGKNSLRAEGNTPLYIVDGIPFGSENLGNTIISGGILPGSGLNPLNTLNPNDIESIEVLKDADATSIYGSRGANGVVLITTKKGKAGNTRFNVTSYTGIGHVTRKLDLMNTEQYLKMREQAFLNDGFTEIPDYAYDVNGTWDRNRYTDWQKELIGGTAYTNSIYTFVSGGSETTRFLIGGTHYKETTVFPGDFAYRKTAVNFNINHSSANKRFEISLSGNYLADKNDLLGTDLTFQAYILAPNAPEPYTEEGELNWENSTWNNPYAHFEEKYLAKNNTLISNGMFIYRPFEHLELKTALGFTDSYLEETKTSPHTLYNPAYGLGSEVSSLMLNDGRTQSWSFEPQLSYQKEVLGGEINALIGTTFQSRTRKQSGFYAWGFSSNSLINNLSAASNITSLGTNNSDYRYNAVFGRINYNYKGRYFLNLTGRRDGSSRFGPGKRFANFGAIGAAWLFSREDLFENISWLSFGKLRGSYGTTGSDLIGDYKYMKTYGLTGMGYDGVMGLEPIQLFNPNFSWESNKKMEGAVEFGFLEDRLSLTVAHYRNRSSNQLVGIPLPGATGFSTVTANLNATVENTGWEFEFGSRIIDTENFKWNTSLNFTLPKNKLLSFPNLEGSTYANRYVIGQPLDIVRVFNYTGMNPETGIYEFEDFDGDGAITAENDRGKIVSTTPQVFGGLQNHLQYKNWEFSFLLQFAKQIGSNFNYFGILPGVGNNLPKDFMNAWEGPGDSSTLQPYTTGLNSEVTNAYYQFISSNAAYSDASYLRLKNLSLSYTIPKWFNSVMCNVYMQGQNLFTITKFKGADPETQSLGMLPPLRILSLGINLSF
jgi:TonB-linked SusC/RagA family outer membrane protein